MKIDHSVCVSAPKPRMASAVRARASADPEQRDMQAFVRAGDDRLWLLQLGGLSDTRKLYRLGL